MSLRRSKRMVRTDSATRFSRNAPPALSAAIGRAYSAMLKWERKNIGQRSDAKWPASTPVALRCSGIGACELPAGDEG